MNTVRIADDEDIPFGSTNPVPVTNQDTASAGLNIYEKTMDTISSFLPLTLTNLITGMTVAVKPNTTTNNPPAFDIAHTSTGSPSFRVPENASYDDQGFTLATNTVFYFSVSSQTNSTLQIITREK